MRAGQPFARSVFITFAASGFEVCRRKGDVGTEPMRERDHLRHLRHPFRCRKGDVGTEPMRVIFSRHETLWVPRRKGDVGTEPMRGNRIVDGVRVGPATSQRRCRYRADAGGTAARRSRPVAKGRKGDVGTEPMREGSAPTGSSRSGRSQRRCRYSADAGRYQKLGAHLERAGRKGDVGA